MWQALAVKYCTVPLAWVMAIIQVESSGNPNALSQGNYGLMQVRVATARELNCGVEEAQDLFIPEININCGCKYLSKQLKRYKEFKAATMAYNQGSVIYNGSPINSFIGLNSEVRKVVDNDVYVNKVMKHFRPVKNRSF